MVKSNKELRTGEPGERNEARKSESAREQLIFEFRPSQGVKSAFHTCQITIQWEQGEMQTKMTAHCTHMETFAEDGQTSWMAR